jgi:hypothetical protein
MGTSSRRVMCAAAAAGALTALGLAGTGTARAVSTTPRARPDRCVTAYVVNSGSDTVTPIRTATSTAGKASHHGRRVT